MELPFPWGAGIKLVCSKQEDLLSSPFSDSLVLRSRVAGYTPSPCWDTQTSHSHVRSVCSCRHTATKCTNTRVHHLAEY